MPKNVWFENCIKKGASVEKFFHFKIEVLQSDFYEIRLHTGNLLGTCQGKVFVKGLEFGLEVVNSLQPGVAYL